MSTNHDWLNLIEVSGPFLAVPVLREMLPQGLEALTSDRPQRLRAAYDEWRDAVDADDAELPAIHSAWIDEVLQSALEVDDLVLRQAATLPERLKVSLPEHGVTIAPDLAIVNPTQGDAPLLLVQLYDPDTDLDATRNYDGLATTPGDRMVALLRAVGCPVGLVTNGERWMLVHAPVGTVASFASWYARLWGQESETLRAFVSLLGVRRFFGPEVERLPALFERSLKHQDDVTDALGEQVRRAVEVLVQSLDRADEERDRDLLHDVEPTELYEAGLTVMMRLVFLLAAEERGLLLLGDPRYDAFYALSTLRMQLRADTEEILERRRSAWSRLLALFRGVYGGIDHPLLRLPAMGGSLFDPDHYPFLEGRKKGTNWRSDPAAPLPIDDRTVLLLLEAIQTFHGRTLSYRALDVEQIGHVYEGLLERTVQRVDDVTLELKASAKAKNARVALGEIESARLEGTTKIVELLKERSERSEPAIRNTIGREPDERVAARLLTVCHGDVALRNRILPYAELLRTDPWGYPLVHHAGAFVVVLGADRRESGTHYTPKSLTEKIVEETLTPIVYRGPAEGAARKDWKLKTADELLDLKVCDPAMGSGAFLVQACRWLADRLVEAWADTEAASARIDDEGRTRAANDTVGFGPLSRDTEERAILARRLIAERCLYGVDKNPLAVELAKLSLWLTTLAKGRPFGFLDHNLRSGDSLLGIHDLGQLTELDMKPKGKAQLRLFGRTIRSAVDKALALRSQLRAIPIRDIGDVEAMAALNAQSRSELALPELIADALVGIILSEDRAGERVVRTTALATMADDVASGAVDSRPRLLKQVKADLAHDAPDGIVRHPFHWPLAYPEVFTRSRPGFDAIIGNPPFLGGKKISSTFGDYYNNALKVAFHPAKGAADICTYFFRLAFLISNNLGIFGFLATNTISQADTREVGLDYLLSSGTKIKHTNPNMKWPGSASLHVSIVVLAKGWNGLCTIDDKISPIVTSFLTGDLGVLEKPNKLLRNFPNASGGTGVLGIGFVVDRQQAEEWLSIDGKYNDVLRPYINGKDLNSRKNDSLDRYVINFNNLTEEEAERYPLAMQRVRELVKPQRDKLTRQIHEECYWKHWDKRASLYEQISKINRVLACSFVSSHLIFDFLPTGWIYSKELAVIPSDDSAEFGALQSTIHEVWARQYSSTMETRLRYSISDALRTFPMPPYELEKLRAVSDSYLSLRKALQRQHGLNLTKIYNAIHDRSNVEIHATALREGHVALDNSLLAAYGWTDVQLNHDFRQASYISESNVIRFTMSDEARLEILRRLTALNSKLHDEEVALGLFKASKRKASQRLRSGDRDAGLFDDEAAEMETVDD